jgi:hypothetical protein
LRTRLADQAGKTERNDESTDAGAQDEAPEILNTSAVLQERLGGNKAAKEQAMPQQRHADASEWVSGNHG